MALALSLLFDRKTSDAVDILWRGLMRSGISSEMLGLGYPPHLTLLVLDEESHDGVFTAALADLAPLAPRQLALGEIRTFVETEVVYIGCEGDLGQLLALHRAAAALVPEGAIRPHYRTANWTPHVTLQTIGDVPSALRFGKDHWMPHHAAVPVRLELATFLPVRVGSGIVLA